MLQEDFVAAFRSLGQTSTDQNRLELFAKKIVENPRIWDTLTNIYYSEKLDPIVGNLDRHRKFVEILHINLVQTLKAQQNNKSQ